MTRCQEAGRRIRCETWSYEGKEPNSGIFSQGEMMIGKVGFSRHVIASCAKRDARVKVAVENCRPKTAPLLWGEWIARIVALVGGRNRDRGQPR